MDDNEVYQTVRAGETEKGKKKHMEIIIIIAVVILAVAIAAAVFVIKGKNKTQEQPSVAQTTTEKAGDETTQEPDIITPVSASDDIDITFEHVTREFMEDFEAHQETTSAMIATKAETVPVTSTVASTTEKKTQISAAEHVEKTTVRTTETAEKKNSVVDSIQSFFDGKFYMDGSMISGGSKTPLEIAMDGNDFHLFSEMDGSDIAIMKKDGKLYIMNPDKKTYAVIDAAMKKMMDLDEESLTFDFAKLKFDGDKPASVTKVTYNGKDGICYTYKDSENGIEFITVGDDIVQIIQSEADGSVRSVIELDEFSKEIPSEMLSFKGYSKKNIISFIKDMM